jgi:hypothetical protein
VHHAELMKRYVVATDMAAVEAAWKHDYTEFKDQCIHPHCKIRLCRQGSRMTTYTIVTGTVRA